MAKTTAGTPTYRDIITAIKKGNFAPVYLLYGEEPYYLDLIVSWLEAKVVAEDDRDFNMETFYGADSDIRSVVAAAQQYPVMAERRLVTLKEAQALNQMARQLEKLSGYLQHPSQGTVLAIVCKGKDIPAKILKLAKGMGAVVFQSNKIPEYQLAAPIRDYCQGKGIGIDDQATDLLISYLGNSLNKLFGEIDKLMISSGKETARITADMVMENIGLNKEFNVYELRKAVASKNYQKAMLICDYFTSNPKQNPVVTIVGTLYSFFSKLVVALFSQDKSDNALLGQMDLKSAWQLKEFKEGMRFYNARQALRAVSRLRQLDCNSKGIGSTMDGYALLRDALFEIMTTKG